MPSYEKSQQQASSIEHNNNVNEPSSSSINQPHSLKEDKSIGAPSGQSSLTNSSNGSDTESRLLSSNADYDHIRNTTLMFFLDRLYIASKDGKEARTLHDLSCLFGTKDFSKEMRQIVGASRNGLKKFLQSYPSLFTIDGDKVYLTQLKQDSNQSVRDYNKEAVEYFTQKLLQFGASLVPIRNLFGYRSQASQEVRHVSGKNTKEFKQFLSAHEDVFELLDDEHVVLKSAFKELQTKDEFNAMLQKTLNSPNEDVKVMDPYLNKQFAHLIEDIMKKLEPQKEQESSRITIEYLHDKLINDCSNKLFLNMVKTIEDLKVFLRMHPKLFKRFRCDEDGKDYVCLLTEDEKRELEQQGYPSLVSRQHSTLHRSDTNESNNLYSSIENDRSSQIQASSSINNNQEIDSIHHKQPLSIINQQQQQQQQAIKKLPTTIEDKSTSQNVISQNNNTNNGHSSLRATAPPFIPSAYLKNQQPASLQIMEQSPILNKPLVQPNQRPIQRSVSNLTPNQAATSQRPGIINPRHAVRSYLLKASAENMSQGLYSPNKHSNGMKPPQAMANYHNHHHYHQPLSRQSSNGSDDVKTRTVNIVREASFIISRIMSTTDAVALDCKGYNLGFNGQITMIQFGFVPNTKIASSACDNNNSENRQPDQKPEVCIFDLITNPELAYSLKPLLESENIVKIVHDVRNKSNLLYSQFEIMLNTVFDTQVANLVIQQQETGKPAYKSRYISMNRLCEIYGNESLMKYRNVIKTKHSGNQTTSGSNKTKDVNYWRTRPLTDAMIYESTMDVYCLVGGVYQNLKAKIKPEYKSLFEDLNKEGIMARITPDQVRSQKKERKIDLEVIDLRTKLYSDTTGLIVLSNREIRLLRHIDLTEEVRRKIQQCKKVAKKLERLDMKAAQNSQMLLQSMGSSHRNSIDGDHSIDAQTNGSSLQSSDQNGESGESRDRLAETSMNEIMDSSMFDELKDKMIESSNLMESLQDDDDDDSFGQLKNDHAKQSASSSGHNEHDHDDCRCNCHRNSVDDGQGKLNTSVESDPTVSDTLAAATTTTTTSDKEDGGESKVVDMAIQCDLLSG